MVVSDSLDAATERAVAAEAERGERLVRSTPFWVLVTLCGALLLVAAGWLASTPVLGDLTSRHIDVLVIGSWAVFSVATLAYRWRSRLYPLTWALDRLSRSLALLTGLALAGDAALPFLLLSIASGFVWSARPAAHVRRMLILEAASHLAVMTTCLVLDHTGSAAVVLLDFIGFAVAQSMTAPAARLTARGRVERDWLEQELLGDEVEGIRGRIARELHDGVGADVMALVLQLREAERPELAKLFAEARLVVEDLRAVVWSLRGEQGSVGELAKLIDASCRRLCGDVAFHRHPLTGDAQQELSPALALTVLRSSQELVQYAASLERSTRVQVSLRAGPSVEIEVVSDGEAPLDTAILERIAQARALVLQGQGTITFKRHGAAGLTLSVQLPALVP